MNMRTIPFEFRFKETPQCWSYEIRDDNQWILRRLVPASTTRN